jgi:glyoxylase-like metal-dependent hydrolase (beta-lactamase superfamily II)
VTQGLDKLAPARWRIGDVTVTQVVELGAEPFPADLVFPGVTPEAVCRHRWLQPHYATEDGRILMSIHAFVIESQGRRIIVDTCVGNDKPRSLGAWHRLQGSFLADLDAAGHPAERIDTVLCTHMHVDHVGWNTRWVGGRWVPTFANARYLFARREWEHVNLEAGAPVGAKTGLHAGDAGPLVDNVIADSLQPMVDAGLADLVEPDHRITDEVWLEPTPGHTPGHVSVRIASAGREAVITGDLMHHPIQCSEPALQTRLDSDAEQARRTRHDFLSRCSNRPVLVLGSHFPPPTAGWLVRAGQGWQLVGDCPAG